ncbi:hypothetical protein TNCV_4479901 [Trichonephila clavipes]|nr:hypothetical protein TNCV_4479901 [Trichonephila clavipes]
MTLGPNPQGFVEPWVGPETTTELARHSPSFNKTTVSLKTHDQMLPMDVRSRGRTGQGKSNNFCVEKDKDAMAN